MKKSYPRVKTGS